MKILYIFLTIFGAFSIFVIGLLMGKTLVNNDLKKTNNNINNQLITPLITPSPTTIPLINTYIKSLKINDFNIGFDYQSDWQILANETIKEENGFSKKSIAINLEKPHIIGDFGFDSDIMIVEYLPLSETSVNDLDNFIKTIVRQELKRTTYKNKNDLQITKVEAQDDLRGINITSYFFQYQDSNKKNHFVHLYSLSQDNEKILNAINLIINSLEII